MMMTNEEMRWLVVGIVMNKVAAPVLRDYTKQGMKTHYTNLDTYCRSLAPPCTLTTLTYHQVKADGNLKKLKFQNINNNLHLHGKSISRYNYNINDSVELAKLYLPDYLAQFSAFDESLDISAILRLLGVSKPTPIFPSPNPFIPIQSWADDVKDNVRNKWGHCNFSQWTEAFFKDCFVKMETLVRSLGLTGGKEKTVLGELSDWKTKGCQLCMGHVVDQQLLSLVQQDVRDLRANFVKTQAEISTLQELVAQQTTEQLEMRGSISLLRDEHAAVQVHLLEHEEQVEEMNKWIEEQIEETKDILKKLQAAEKSFEEEIRMRLQRAETRLVESVEKVQQMESDLCATNVTMVQVQEGLAETDIKVEQLQEGLAETDGKVEQLEEGLTDTNMKVEQLQEGLCDKVKELELVVRVQRMRPNVVECPSVERFDVETCRSKLAEHYRRTATVPTSVWSKKCPVDMREIYTRLTWVKQEQTPEGSSKPELKHYTEVFDENENGLVSSRILVQGETGIGKTTFVKKMGLDWAELVDERTIDKQCQDAGARCEAEGSVTQDFKTETSKEECIKGRANETETLKRFDLVLVVNLKEVSKYSSLRDVICRSNIFPEEDTAMAERLLNYITNNQEKVLLVFDGYDEYRCGMNSEIYEIFRGKKLRNCWVLITTRTSKADDLLGEFKVVHAEITGFSFEERLAFMYKMLGSEADADELEWHLICEGLFELARIPLLLLFFCTLWKKGKSNSFPETKTKLYYAIVQYVLDHNQRESPPARFHRVEEYNDILVEIGKVALDCLLRDDHVFEFDQLSASIIGEESHIIGLLQVTEFSENLRPAGMVSFIHKSIQEFLAAWYITCRCVPDGDLGEIRDKAHTLEDCQSLENVLQFICGLSDTGAEKVFELLTCVRISNRELDLSKAMAYIKNERDMKMPSATYKHLDFGALVYTLFDEVQSKRELLKVCFNCTGGIVLVTRRLTEVLKKTKLKNSSDVILSDVLFLILESDKKSRQILRELADCLGCLDISVSTPNTCSLGKFLLSFQGYEECVCGFTSILLFCDRQFKFYITSFRLSCYFHDKFFTGTTVAYKYLTSIALDCIPYQVCDILESVPNPSTCELKIGRHRFHTVPEGEKLASLLPRFPSVVRLMLSSHFTWSAATAEALITSVSSKMLEELTLHHMSFTPAASAALGRSLPEMLSLRNLELSGFYGSVLLEEEMKALFGGFNKGLPLTELRFSGFSVRGCLHPLTKSLRFFPNMLHLELGDVNLDEQNLLHLLRSLEFIPCLEKLIVRGGREPQTVLCSKSCADEEDIHASFTHSGLKDLELREIELTQTAAAALGRVLPGMSSLEELKCTRYNGDANSSGRLSERLHPTRRVGGILQRGEIKALFGGIYKPLPLKRLSFVGFTVEDCHTPLAEYFRFFPNLQRAELDICFLIDENDFSGFVERFGFLSCLETTIIHCNAVTSSGYSEEGKTKGCLKMNARNLCLLDLSLTPGAASVLGRFIPEITSLLKFAFTGKDGNVLQGEDVEVLFGQCYKALPLRQLILRGLTPEAAAALSGILPKMSSLAILELKGLDGCVLEANEMNVLCGGFIKESPLIELTLCDFSVRGCLAPLSKCLHFLPNLSYLKIGKVNMDEHNFLHLLRGLKHLPNLERLTVEGKPYINSVFCLEELDAEVTFTLNNLESLYLSDTSLTTSAVLALFQLLPGMSSLIYLYLSGIDGTPLQLEGMNSLFERFNKPLPLRELIFEGFKIRSGLTPLAEVVRFFPDLEKVEIDIDVGNDDLDLCGFLGSDLFCSRFSSCLRSVVVVCKALIPAISNEEVFSMSHLHLQLNQIRELTLLDISLTPALTSALGRALSKMLSLEELWLETKNETVLKGGEVEALFGGFHEDLPMKNLVFRGFSVKGSLAPLAQSFRFFPDLRSVNLDVGFNTEDEESVCVFLESIRFMKYFKVLDIQCEAPTGGTEEVTTVGRLSTKSSGLDMVLSGVTLNPAVSAAVCQSLCEMPLTTLKLTGGNGTILNAVEIEALFGGFNTTMSVRQLDLSGFDVQGHLAFLTSGLKFFPDLTCLSLSRLNMDGHDLQALLNSFRFLPKLRRLDLSHNPLGYAIKSIVPHLIELPTLRFVDLRQTASTEDLTYFGETVQRLLPRLEVYID